MGLGGKILLGNVKSRDKMCVLKKVKEIFLVNFFFDKEVKQGLSWVGKGLTILTKGSDGPKNLS